MMWIILNVEWISYSRGISYTVLGWEDYYATDADIIKYYNSL